MPDYDDIPDEERQPPGTYENIEEIGPDAFSLTGMARRQPKADTGRAKERINAELQMAQEWHNVSSSNVAAIRMRGPNALQVKFIPKGKNQPPSIWEYVGPDMNIFREMLKCASKGTFMHQMIYPRFGKGRKVG